MSGKMTLERCFKEAEETGRLNLSLKNLRDFPDPTEDCELIDVIEIGQLHVIFLPQSRFIIFFFHFSEAAGLLGLLTLLSCRSIKEQALGVPGGAMRFCYD